MLKRFFIASIAAFAGVFAFSASASAAPCTTTTYMQDGRPLTAAVVNPPTLSGTVDGTGCDIGVFYSGGTHTVNGATIQNAFYYGVLAINPGTHVDISNSEVKWIGDGLGGTFFPTGAQHGVGIGYRQGSSGLVDNSYIHQYQKNGLVISGSGTSVGVIDDHVQGLGPTPLIAQNGVQYSNHSSGIARGNLIEDHEYTGPQDTFSTGLLLFDIDPPDIKHSLNHYRDNDRNVVVVPSSSLK